MPPDAPAFRLQLNTNLVLVPVVVRDASGHAVTDLTRDDFEVYDKGKRQKISDFTVEMQEGLTSRTPSNVPNQASPKSPVAPLPVNFVVYLFDDLHLQTDDLVRARNAVLRQLDTIPANNRVAVLATSGLVEQSFTPDRQKLRNALLRLRAEPLGDVSQGRCPHIGYYIARRFLMGNDNLLRKALIAETLACLSLPPPSDGPGFHDTERIASNQLMQTARSVVQTGEQQSREALLELRDIIHAMAKAPGQRTVILISRGFLLGDTAQFEASDVLDDAIRNQVVISTLDARGLYVLNPAGDIEEKGYVPELIAVTHLLKADEAIAITGVMQEMAEGTGGTFIRNTNDLDTGLQRLTLPPGCTYVLAFKPTHIKLNGSYHPLTVKVKTRERTTVQARRGYYATQRR